MKLTNTIKGNIIILFTALRQSKPVAEVRQGIQEALDEAWTDAWTPGNIRAQVKWQRLFPGARKPSVEEFIAVLAATLKEDELCQQDQT